jgi:hypothetical protein
MFAEHYLKDVVLFVVELERATWSCPKRARATRAAKIREVRELLE